MSKNYELMRKTGEVRELNREALPATRSSSLVQPHGTTLGPSAAASQVAKDSDLDLRAILQTISRRRAWIYSCTAAMLLLAGLVCIFMPRQYRAQAELEILKQDVGGVPLGTTPTAAGDSDPLDFNLSLQTQLNVLKSDTLAWQVIEQTKLADVGVLGREVPTAPAESNTRTAAANDRAPSLTAAKVLRRFQKKLKVDAVSGTRLITVSYMDHDPKLAARVVNQLVSDFVEYTFQVRYLATTKATNWLGQQLVDLKAELETAQQHAADLQKQSGILGEDEHHNIVLSRLEQLNNELTSAEADRVAKENVYKLAQSGNPELVASMLGAQPPGPNGTSNAIPSDSAALLNKLREQETALNAEYADAATKYGAAYPKLIQIKERLDAVRASITAELHRISQQAKSDYELAGSREAATRKAFDEQKAAATQMNDKAIDYLLAKQEADSSRTLYDHLLQNVKEAGVLAGLHSTQIHVVDPAEIPIRPARPNIPLYLGGGLLSGLLLGLVCAFVVDALDTTIRDVDAVETRTYVPVLGVIPGIGQLSTAAASPKHWLHRPADELEAGGDKNLRALLPSLHSPAVAEAFRSACASLLLSRPQEPTKVLLVTSGMAQEGKSFSSLNLAASLARNGRRVLLVDADLRRRSLTRVLHQDSAIGLREALCGEGEMESMYQPVGQIPGLLFLPAGGYQDSGFERLQSEQTAEAVRTWRQRFDHVVIDTPPVLPVTDAVLLSPTVDAVIVVVRFGMTNLHATMRTLRMLRSVQAPRLSMLMNAMDMRSPEYNQYFGSYGYQNYKYRDAEDDQQHAPVLQLNREEERA